MSQEKKTQDPKSQDSKSQEPKGKDAPPEAPKESLSETRHQVTIGESPLQYKAIAGNIVIKDEEGKPRANFVFTAYTKEDPGPLSQRPITFSFNGGPGSSSVWLHLGAFGPRRVAMPDEPRPPAPPYQLVENHESILDLTDLVFIDPVTTGYTRALPSDDAKKYHGVQEDVEIVAEFIRLYTTRFQRWASPKYLAGESYGTTRAAALADYLQTRHGMFFNGLLLISSVLSFQTVEFHPANDSAPLLILPTYTATAFYHAKLAPELLRDLRATLDEVERFAAEEYSVALFKGSALPTEQRQATAEKLARYTGLSKAAIERMDLRPELLRFSKELLRDQGKTVGRLDTRFLGADRDAAGEHFEYDPSYSAILGAFTAMLNHYLRTDLRYESDLPYEILSERVHPWNYGDKASNQYLDVSEQLRLAMMHNPALKIFVGSGYYDLATPYFATDYTFRHLGLTPLAHRVTVAYYESGHMMYIHAPSRRKLKEDLRGFYQA